MVRKKKQEIKPVVAKPLNDTEKRNLVTSFVTNNINDNVIKNVTEDDSKNITNEGTKNMIDKVTNYDNENITNKVTDDDTKTVTNNITRKGTNNDTKSVTSSDTDNVTKKFTKKVTIVKTISIGKKEIVAKFNSDKKQRPNYNLSEDTIEKIEKISDILGYKKAEFVDIYLNGTLTKILKSLEKSK